MSIMVFSIFSDGSSVMGLFLKEIFFQGGKPSQECATFVYRYGVIGEFLA